jgi:hypothetical protein
MAHVPRLLRNNLWGHAFAHCFVFQNSGKARSATTIPGVGKTYSLDQRNWLLLFAKSTAEKKPVSGRFLERLFVSSEVQTDALPALAPSFFFFLYLRECGP